jgi:prepilin-type N-terminal cleavage/methylation domain-containing protein
MSRLRRRTGFTLLEVLLALMLTAVAVTIAATAVRAATTARERVLAHEQRDGQWLRLRAQLTDMLRHAPIAESVDEPLLRVTHDTRDNASLTFLSTGVRPPFGTGPTWRVALTVVDSTLVLDATPIGASTTDATRLRTVLDGVTVMQVQLLERAGGLSGAQWRTTWPLERARPASVALSFDASVAPLQVSLDPLPSGGVRR